MSNIEWTNETCQKNSELVFIGLIMADKIQIDGKGRFYSKGKRIERKTPQGYLQLRKMIDGHRHHVGAHRISYLWFKGLIPKGMIVNHTNGLKDDNRPENLELATYSENLKHAHRSGLKDQRGERNPNSKLSSHEVAQIRLSYSKGGITQDQLAKRFNVSFQTISKIVRGDRRSSDLGVTGDYSQRRSVNKQRNSKGRFVGKKKAGNQLDNQIHNEFPKTT